MYDWQASSSMYGDPASLRPFLTSNKADHAVPSEVFDAPSVSLTNEQFQVMKILESQLNCEGEAPQLVLVQGKAGCGKSTIIQAMTARIAEALGPDSFLLLAPTGAAALNICGNTVHAALRLPVKQSSYSALQGAAFKKLVDDFENVRFLIIDEFSMLSQSLLGMIERRCGETKPRSKAQLFGGVNVYLIGDVRQLPPVGGRPLYLMNSKTELELRGAYAYGRFRDAVVLTVSKRQTDPAFRDALDSVSRGECPESTYNLFQLRFRECVEIEDSVAFSQYIHLFTTREPAQKFNLKRLLDLHCPIARVPARHNNSAAEAGSPDDAGGLHPVVYLALGARVVLKANLWVKTGLVNGAQGTVVDIVYQYGKKPPDDLPAAVLVRFDKYSGPTIQGAFPIAPICREWKKGQATCLREQLPLCLESTM